MINKLEVDYTYRIRPELFSSLSPVHQLKKQFTISLIQSRWAMQIDYSG